MTLEETIVLAVMARINHGAIIGQDELRRISREHHVPVGYVRFLVTRLEREGRIVIHRLSNLDHRPVEIRLAISPGVNEEATNAINVQAAFSD
jgi:hypothetical protein